MKSQYENYYDSKSHMFEELKMEVPDTEVPHSDSNVNKEIVSEDKELSNFNFQNKIKHEATENGLPLNVTIKTEHIVEEEILDNNKNMSEPYKLTIQDVQLNSNERLLKDNVNLLKPSNEQSNMLRVAELNELHKCKHCDIHFDHRDDMLVHISLVHNEKMFKCELCGKQLNKLSNLKRHIILLHKHKEPPKVAEIIFKCINCNDEFNNKLTLNDHAKLCQKEEVIIAYKCDSCDGVYNSEHNYNCCGAGFKKNHCLTNQMKYRNYDYGRTYDCVCGKQYRSLIYLRRHQQRQHEQTDKESFQCDSCQQIFKNKRYLNNHIRKVHYDYGRTFGCWCGKQFRSPLHLRDHKCRQHERKIKDTDNGRFQCDSCQTFLKTRQCLVIHIKRFHYDYGRTFACWCGKRFQSPIHLSDHKHQWHKPKIKDADNDKFQCDSCQKFFTRKHNLIKHIRTVHYDYGRTFACWCGKQFRSPEYLRRHKRKQHKRTDKGRFQCESCQKCFEEKQSLFIHVKRFHYESESTSDC